MKKQGNKLYAGIDIGSTTVKIAILSPDSYNLLYSDYRRHNADLPGTVCSMLEKISQLFPDSSFITAVCGSGGISISKGIGSFFIQEVVANSLVIRKYYRDVRVSIELGGQDAKVVFFTPDTETGQLIASDMRMNGSCAGGTGAFIDQVAELLSIKTEEFGALAEAGKRVYDISGRCGVFAKTDIQPLLNHGVSREDIALSTFHAIAKQTIGGLAQGMEIKPKVIFEGGPLTFNRRLVSVFRERLSLGDDEVVIPERPEILVAFGAALSIDQMFSPEGPGLKAAEISDRIRRAGAMVRNDATSASPLFFRDKEEMEDFYLRHGAGNGNTEYSIPEGCLSLDVYIGIDAGSTTSKLVLIDRECSLVDSYYSNNHGEPLKVIKYALLRLYEKYEAMGVRLNVLGLGTTGYGEMLFSKAFMADYHTVETVAHAEAAQFFVPDVSFILDIGGQDMKAISLRKGIVTGIVLNEACSAGCGSFVETYAKSLGISVERVAELAFRSKNPSQLGSRCTVFMNSSIITEQKNGKKTEDILAGISRSIIENVFTKVVRVSNFSDLGEKVVVQGGTFRNDAVLRAFEQYTGRNVIRAPYPGEMGAFGIALLAKKHMEEKSAACGAEAGSSFSGFRAVAGLDYVKKPSVLCTFCANMCSRTIIAFNNGLCHVTGNRCEKGEIVGSEENPDILEKLKNTSRKLDSVPDMVMLHNRLIAENYPVRPPGIRRGIKIGIPRTLEFWNSLPFWKTLFTALGFETVVSSRSSYDIFEKGLKYVPSDTACFPAKLVHGHAEELAEKRVDRIFLPMMIRLPAENSTAEGNHTCVMLQGYPMVVEKSSDLFERTGIRIDTPIFHWYNDKLRKRQISAWLRKEFGIDNREAKNAISQADSAMRVFRDKMLDGGWKILKNLEDTDDFAVLLAGRPYHSDLLVNHSLSRYFTSMGIPVLTLDSLPGLDRQDLSDVRMETTITFHTRMDAAAIAVANHPNLEIVQIVSFGCGHDAIISDEMIRELRKRCSREMLVLKLDEGEAAGPLNIRIKSFIETVKARRRAGNAPAAFTDFKDENKVIYTKKDRKERIILAPNLSPAFSLIFSSVMGSDGIRIEPLPVADKRAIALGKKYVHNDICFPAQINIGEALAYLEKADRSKNRYAIGLAKNCEACRAGQYAALARKALDEAGFSDVALVTTGKDTKGIHPGFTLTLRHQIKLLWGLTIVDTMEMMLRRIRPYEKVKGLSENIFSRNLKILCGNITRGRDTLLDILAKTVDEFNSVETTDGRRRPRVGLVGEILVNYHPAANCYIESYLEANGMEVVQPAMHDFFRKTAIIEKEIGRRGMAPNSLLHYFVYDVTDRVYDYVHKKVWGIIDSSFRFSGHRGNIYDIVENIKPFMDITYIGAEGWKLPGEIMEMFAAGVNSFVIMQPFGCLPNHITGRGMIKTLKKYCPNSQMIALDYDPDTSIGNVENRLQMLIINARELENRDLTA